MKILINKSELTHPPADCPSCKHTDFCISGADHFLHLACNSCRHFLCFAATEDELNILNCAVMEFGKYKSITIKEIAKFDPSYLQFMRSNMNGTIKNVLDYRIKIIMGLAK